MKKLTRVIGAALFTVATGAYAQAVGPGGPGAAGPGAAGPTGPAGSTTGTPAGVSGPAAPGPVLGTAAGNAAIKDALNAPGGGVYTMTLPPNSKLFDKLASQIGGGPSGPGGPKDPGISDQAAGGNLTSYAKAPGSDGNDDLADPRTGGLSNPGPDKTDDSTQFMGTRAVIPSVDIIVRKKPGDIVVGNPTTGDDGSYRLDGLAPGKYEVLVPGQKPKTILVGKSGVLKGVARRDGGTGNDDLGGGSKRTAKFPGAKLDKANRSLSIPNFKLDTGGGESVKVDLTIKGSKLTMVKSK